MSHFSLTTFLAVWGALLSSVTFGWNLLRDWKDRAKVRLTANVRVLLPYANGGVIAATPALLPLEERVNLKVVISVANVGRRPLRWVGVGGHYKRPVNGKEGFVVMARHLPRSLAEAEAHDETAEMDQQFIDDNIKDLFIWDSFNRNWELPKKELRKVIKDCRIYAGVESAP